MFTLKKLVYKKNVIDIQISYKSLSREIYTNIPSFNRGKLLQDIFVNL